MRKEHIKLSPVYYDCLTQLVAQQRLPADSLKQAKALLSFHQGQSYHAVSLTQQVKIYILRNWVAQFKASPLSLFTKQSRSAPSSVKDMP